MTLEFVTLGQAFGSLGMAGIVGWVLWERRQRDTEDRADRRATVEALVNNTRALERLTVVVETFKR